MFIREIDTGFKSAIYNMALDETFLESNAIYNTPITLRFLSFSPPAVLVGFSQVIEQEIRLNYCAENGIDINRRITGGGAVLFDSSQIGWEIIGPKSSKLFPQRIEDLYIKIGNLGAMALQKLGLDAKYKPRNDIEINGKKISGMGGTEYNGSFLFQGTLLVKDEIEMMIKSLKIPVEKLTQKELGSIRERVTCIERELGYIPNRDEIKKAFRIAASEIFDVDIIEDKLTSDEINLLNKKLSFFESDKWINRIQYPSSRQGILETSYRCIGGIIKIAMVVNSAKNTITATYISGDYFIEPKEKILDLERLLKNIPMNQKYVENIVMKFFSDNQIKTLSISIDDFLLAFNEIFLKWSNVKNGFTIVESNRIMLIGDKMQGFKNNKPKYFLFPYCAKESDCYLRYDESCDMCGKCKIGDGYEIMRSYGLIPITVINFEHLWDILMKIKSQGERCFIGSCCNKFYTKHYEEFHQTGMNGILIDIESETCYDLGRALSAYKGKFKGKTEINLELIQKILNYIYI